VFERHTASWKNIITTAIANGMVKHPHRQHFTKDEVVSFLRENWEAVCTGRSQTKTWWATVGTCMSTSRKRRKKKQSFPESQPHSLLLLTAETFVPQPGRTHSASSPFTILDTDIRNIRPSPPGHPSKPPNEAEQQQQPQQQQQQQQQQQK